MELHRVAMADMCDQEDLITAAMEDKVSRGEGEENSTKIQAQRKVELKTFADIGVYTYTTMAKAKGDQEGVLIDTTWVDDVVKGKSRLCAREFANDTRLDLFAPTPSLTASKWVVSEAASQEEGGGQRRLMVMDVKRAFLYGRPGGRYIYVSLRRILVPRNPVQSAS